MILAPTLTLSAGSGAAIVRPTFSRDFAGEKTLNNGTGPAITFTRASNATFFDASGVLQTAANDVARFDHSQDGAANSLGLLIEEARTNSFERSAEFNNAYWGKNGATITANTSTAPDGTTSADTLSETIANAGHFISRSISVTSGTSYTFSVFAKAGTSNILLLTLQEDGFGANTRAWFNLSTGAAGSTVGSPTATSIQPVGNGWHRCSITKAATATAASLFYIQIAESDGAFAAYVGDTADNILIWGAQLEAGAFPTSYIPTTTAEATRSADSAVVAPISSFYNQAEGTLFAEATRQFVASGAGHFARFATISDGTTDESVSLNSGFADPRLHRFAVVDGGAASIQSDTSPTMLANTVYKMAGSYALNNFAFYQNGSQIGTDNSGSLPTPTTFQIGGERQVHIRKIAYYPKRLSNALLQQLTT